MSFETQVSPALQGCYQNDFYEGMQAVHKNLVTHVSHFVRYATVPCLVLPVQDAGMTFMCVVESSFFLSCCLSHWWRKTPAMVVQVFQASSMLATPWDIGLMR